MRAVTIAVLAFMTMIYAAEANVLILTGTGSAPAPPTANDFFPGGIP